MSENEKLNICLTTLASIREIWVGSECGEPKYAQEAYAIRLLKQCYEEAIEAIHLVGVIEKESELKSPTPVIVISKYRKKCSSCGSVKYKYSEQYDAYYCPQCGNWKESMCMTRNCEFCKNRPDRMKEDV